MEYITSQVAIVLALIAANILGLVYYYWTHAKYLREMKRGFGVIIFIIIAALLVSIGYGVYQYREYLWRIEYTGYTPPIQVPLPPESEKSPPPEAEIDTSMWKTYRNEIYGFEIAYPSDWILDDRSHTYEGRKTAGVSVRSPVRHDIPGYEIPGAYYSLCFGLSDLLVTPCEVSGNQFLKVREGNEQAPLIVSPPEGLANSKEHRLAQRIIESVRFLNESK